MNIGKNLFFERFSSFMPTETTTPFKKKKRNNYSGLRGSFTLTKSADVTSLYKLALLVLADSIF